MTIEEGTGDEFLLTCFNCKNPFGLVAQFCGYCQATRQQALGIERVRANQQILETNQVAPQQQQYQQPPQQQYQQQPPQQQPREKIFTPSQQTPPPMPSAKQEPSFLPPKKSPVIRQKSMFKENMGLRITAAAGWQKKRSKSIATLGWIFFLATSYVSIQTYIFVANTPIPVAESHLYLGASRDATYFNVSSENSGTPFFPTRYSVWPDADSSQWTTSASWNGWKGEATVDFTAGGGGLDGIPITGNFDAKYKTFLGIFRQIEWQAETPATFTVDYPDSLQMSIYINGLAAGTTERPAVREGQYQMYPGTLEFKYFDLATGEELSQYGFRYFIDASGRY